LVGDEIEGILRWKDGKDLTAVAGKMVRLRFLVQDADVSSLRFGPSY